MRRRIALTKGGRECEVIGWYNEEINGREVRYYRLRDRNDPSLILDLPDHQIVKLWWEYAT